MGKNSIFKNIKVKNLKNLEILQSKRDFFNFLQAIAFDTFHARKLKLSTYVLYWEYYRKIKNQKVVG